MSDHTSGEYTPGTYTKGDDVRTATTAAKAVALVFDGYKLVEDEAPAESETEAPTEADTKTEADAPSTVAPSEVPETKTETNDTPETKVEAPKPAPPKKD